jgi:hypothetical protein
MVADTEVSKSKCSLETKNPKCSRRAFVVKFESEGLYITTKMRQRGWMRGAGIAFLIQLNGGAGAGTIGGAEPRADIAVIPVFASLIFVPIH